MFIILEVVLILVISLIYLNREKNRKIKEYRSGDIIWVRENLFKPRKAILCNWDNYTFRYIPTEDDELKETYWLFLIRNDTYRQRRSKPQVA